MNDAKVYVDVLVNHMKNGKIIPLCIRWEDGEKYRIDQILDVIRAASTKAGGTGIRYTIRIGNTTSFLFLEEDKWFVERRG
ncbi:hypothetical protein LJC56_11075 [Christensenellaceae bacterium OttesenSCG-928-K19]|nr:hypothetical protein [Christensenellaceae bacterium OttesenSCG-928-K19]